MRDLTIEVSNDFLCHLLTPCLMKALSTVASKLIDGENDGFEEEMDGEHDSGLPTVDKLIGGEMLKCDDGTHEELDQGGIEQDPLAFQNGEMQGEEALPFEELDIGFVQGFVDHEAGGASYPLDLSQKQSGTTIVVDSSPDRQDVTAETSPSDSLIPKTKTRNIVTPILEGVSKGVYSRCP